MTLKKHLTIEASGYITRIVCGKLPIAGKNALVDYLLTNRDDSSIPGWIIRRNPDYVSTEEVKRLWYLDKPAMEKIMRDVGLDWPNPWVINEFCDIKGFGSGKEGIGLFEIRIHMDDEIVMELYPFKPAFESSRNTGRIDDIGFFWKDPAPVPPKESAFVAVSAGSWAKGTAFFDTEIQGPFLFGNLEMVLADLTNMGTGEDSFVAGFRYAGNPLPIRITREIEPEFLPVSWFSAKKNRWLKMGDPD